MLLSSEVRYLNVERAGPFSFCICGSSVQKSESLCVTSEWKPRPKLGQHRKKLQASPLKDAISDFGPIGLQHFDLKFHRYFDGGRESYKRSFEPLLENVRQLLVAVK